MKKIESHLSWVYGMDYDNNIWQWGGYNFFGKVDGEDDIYEDRFEDSNEKARKIVWFKKQGLKVLDFAVGGAHSLYKCEQSDGGIALYGIRSGSCESG